MALLGSKGNVRRSLLAVVLLLMLCAIMGRSQEPTLAPENADFQAFISGDFGLQQMSVSSETSDFGLIPEPINLSHMTKQTIQSVNTLSVFPAAYDLRVTGRLTSVKSQGGCGSCWAHAALGSLESNLMPGEEWNFSENNLKNRHGFDIGCCSGGNRTMSTAYLVRWDGAVAESADAYNSVSCTSPNAMPARRVDQVIYVPNRSGPLDNNGIKQAIITYGAIYTTYFHSDYYYNSHYKSYYYAGTAANNHAVCIVGWDDNFDRNKFNNPPPGNGAFIAKNSWGSYWGESGYFYISYYDTGFGKENAAFISSAQSAEYSRIYQYDTLGWVTSLGYGTNTAWCANVFTAVADEAIVAVGLYAASLNTSYEIYVHTNPRSGPTGTVAGSKSGVLANAGYNTIRLNAPINVSAGQKFSIVVKLITPGFSYPIPIERPFSGYSSNASASAGQSYVSSNGSIWTDLTANYPNANVCLKALSVTQALEKTATPTFSPDGGIFYASQNVFVTCATAGAVIRYTTDGSEPSENSAIVSGPISISCGTILKAKAWKNGLLASDVKSASYSLKVATPVFTPGGTTFIGPQYVTVNCATPGAIIRYTTNGLEPTESDALISGPVAIDRSLTLKARAWKDCWAPSDVRTDNYTINTQSRGSISGTVYGASSRSIDRIIECSHPYRSSYYGVWTIYAPEDTTKMRVRFSKLEFERGFDFLKIRDGNGKIVESISCYPAQYGIWSNWVPGRVMRLYLNTNSRRNFYGFRIDRIELQSGGTSPLQGVTITLEPSGRQVVTGSDGRWSFAELDDGLYTVRPSFEGESFSPSFKNIRILQGANITGADFFKN